jgi:hypothetical protein
MNAKQLRSFVEVVSQITARLICVGSLVWFGLIVADSITSQTYRGQATQTAADDSQTAVDIPELLTTANGYWTFDGTELSTQRVICNTDELVQRLDSLTAINRETITSKRHASRLVALAESGGAVRNACPAGTLWSLDKADFKLRLLTSLSVEPNLIGAAFAFYQNEHWQLTILKPRAPRQNHLLPLPADSKTICARRSESGQLQMELVTTTRANSQLLKQWRSEGWDIHRVRLGIDGFSYLCVRDDESVYVWSEHVTGSRTIMLSAATNHPAPKTVSASTP